MSDWRQFCRGHEDIVVDTDTLTISLGNGRTQMISVQDTAALYELRSTVLRPGLEDDVPDVLMRVWRRNRSARLVGYRIDGRGKLVATAWVPKAGLTAHEFVRRVHRLASEADLFEYQLTGKDRE